MLQMSTRRNAKARVIIFFILLVVIGGCVDNKEIRISESSAGPLKLELIVDEIPVPFGMTFLADSLLLVTDRPSGAIFMVDVIRGNKKRLRGVTPSFANGDGGALDILAHPDYRKNGWIYFAHSIGDSAKSTLAIERFQIVGDSVVNVHKLATILPYFDKPNHYGTRMALDKGYLYFSMGDRYHLPDSAQSLGNHLGKIMRIKEDGAVPDDNPFIGVPGALAEIWSIGHRNPHGLLFHPVTGELWENEHGPKGGDEVNILQKGKNYGWPIICYGIDYDGEAIGEGITHKEGLEQPLYHFTPSIAPGGMDFYTGSEIPEWNGSLFIGALALRHLNRLEIKNGEVVGEERLLEDLEMRIRNVKQGPDGNLYIAADGGKILRIVADK